MGLGPFYRDIICIRKPSSMTETTLPSPVQTAHDFVPIQWYEKESDLKRTVSILIVYSVANIGMIHHTRPHHTVFCVTKNESHGGTV